jgi:predicted nucleic acid-binding protein
MAGLIDTNILLYAANGNTIEHETAHEFLTAGNLFFDIRTVVLMREHGIRVIYTTDTDFLQFKAIEVVNPLLGQKRQTT